MNFHNSIYSKFKYIKYGFIPAIFTREGTQHDIITESPTSKTLENTNNVENQTGWDRLYMMYSRDEFDQPSPEIVTVYQSIFAGGFIGAMYGGVVTSKHAHLDYMEKNTEKMFENPMQARKELQDKFTLNFARGAYRWGWRVALFTSTYILGTTSFATYRGKSGILEHTIGGALAGSLYKIKMGLTGSLVGAGVGAVLGTFGGIITFGLLKVSGSTMEDMHKIRNKWRGLRKRGVSATLDEESILKELAQESERSNLDIIPDSKNSK